MFNYLLLLMDFCVLCYPKYCGFHVCTTSILCICVTNKLHWNELDWTEHTYIGDHYFKALAAKFSFKNKNKNKTLHKSKDEAMAHSCLEVLESLFEIF